MVLLLLFSAPLREELLSNSVSKAVIMARGLGTRMRQVDSNAALTAEQSGVAEHGVKGMIPVGRPFMDYLLSALAESGFTHVCLVTGPEHETVRAYYDRLDTLRITISHAIQTKPRGTADAVAAASGFAGSDQFLVLNSDNYYPPGALRAVRELNGPGLIAFSARAMIEQGGVPDERVAAFPRVETDGNGFLSRLSTGETREMEGYASMNLWRFGPRIFEACQAIAPSSRGEFELPDAVEYSMARLGERYQVLRSDEPVLDLSSRADVARVTRQLEGVDVRL